MPFYAVHKGRIPGIYKDWTTCHEQVNKFSGAVYKKFPTEKQANDFLLNGYKPISATLCSSTNKIQENEISSISSKINSSNTLKRKTKFIQPVKSKALKLNLDDHSLKDVPIVFTDGACSKNGKKKARAGYGVWWGFNDPLNQSCKLEGIQTNQRAEIAAINAALKQAIEHEYKKIVLCTDSMFVINCITLWSPKWKRNNWKKSDGNEVIHKKEFIEILESLKSVEVVWKHVRGHSGILGNEMADKLAVSGSKMPKC